LCPGHVDGIKKNDPTPARALVKFTFNELETHLDGSAKKSWVFLQPRIFDRFDQEASNPAGGIRKKFAPAPEKWRKLIVTARPQGVEGKFDDTVMEQPRWGPLATRNPDGPDIELNRQGGVGIFVRLGSAYYRNLEVSSLPAQAK
jgi:hypothetical protein